MRALGLHVVSCYQYGKPGWVKSPSDFTRVIGASSSPGFRWAWQTTAWSGGKRVPGAVLFQREVVTAGDPGALIDGVSVDVADVLAPDLGQWDLPR